MTQAVAPKRMTALEARRCATKIKEAFEDARTSILVAYDLVAAFHAGEGWIGCGYATWEECIEKEFEEHRSTVFRAVAAGRVAQEIRESQKVAQGDFFHIPERQLRELAKVEPGKRAEAYAEATKNGTEPTTAKKLGELADRYEKASTTEEKLEIAGESAKVIQEDKEQRKVEEQFGEAETGDDHCERGIAKVAQGLREFKRGARHHRIAFGDAYGKRAAKSAKRYIADVEALLAAMKEKVAELADA